MSPDFYVQDATLLFRGGYGGSASVQALSPSTATVTNAYGELAERLLTGEPTRRFKKCGPNDLSVAVLIQVSQLSLLLGADLEYTPNPQFGWQAVFASPSRPDQPSDFFKVAHHGSDNADHPRIWSDLLRINPLAIVTPFAPNSLPRDQDVERMKVNTQSLYCTTWPPTTKPTRRQRVDKFVGPATRNRRALNRSSGFIKVRFDLSTNHLLPEISLYGSAASL